jgi:uncharacterized protein
VFADTPVFHEPGRNPVSGDYQVSARYSPCSGSSPRGRGGTFRVTVHDVVANDEHAVGLHVAEGEREGRRLHSLQTVRPWAPVRQQAL